jgi:peptidyl-prolyl cis-trans isomerase D
MLSQLRKVTRGWIALAVIGLLTAAFVMWGINDMFRPVSPNLVASGKGVAVPQEEFGAMFNRAFRVAQQRDWKVTRDDLVEANVHNQIAGQLVSEHVFNWLARNMGVATSDAAVRNNIEQLPVFRDDLGQFDRLRMMRLLEDMQMSEGQLVDETRRNLGREQLLRPMFGSLRAPASFGAIELAFESEKRTAAVAAIPPVLAGPPVTPTDAEIQALYNSSKERFALPEFRAFTIVRAELEPLAAKVEVPEDEIRKLYEYRKDQLATPERRSFVQLSGAPDRATAEAAGKRLAAGEDPAAVARALKMEVLELNDKTQKEAPIPALGAPIFKLSPGQVTEPAQSVRWAVAKLVSVTPAHSPDFAEMRDQLRTERAKEDAQELLAAAVETFDETRDSGAPIEEAAAKAGFRVEKVDFITAQGLNQQAQPAPAVLDQPDLVQAVFEASESEPSDWRNLENGDSFLVRVDSVKPAGPPPLATVRDKVALLFELRRRDTALRKIADTIIADVKGGAAFQNAVGKQRAVQITPGAVFTRNATPEQVAPGLLQAIYTTPEGGATMAYGGPGNAVLFVARVEKIQRADPKVETQAVEALRAALRQPLEEDLVVAAQMDARRAAKVKLNQPLIDQLAGKTDEKDKE